MNELQDDGMLSALGHPRHARKKRGSVAWIDHRREHIVFNC